MANETEVLCRVFDEDVIVNTTSRSIGTVVGVSCKDGYKLQGASVLTCEYTGYWSTRKPFCLLEGNSNQVLIIVICSIASAVALGVLVCGLYMLFSNLRKERTAKAQERDLKDTLRELNIYHAVTQDCVGMPPVVYDNMNSSLRGRTSSSDDSKPNSPAMSGSETDLATEKAFIY